MAKKAKGLDGRHRNPTSRIDKDMMLKKLARRDRHGVPARLFALASQVSECGTICEPTPVL